jgi:hypothetical protein
MIVAAQGEGHGAAVSRPFALSFVQEKTATSSLVETQK